MLPKNTILRVILFCFVFVFLLGCKPPVDYSQTGVSDLSDREIAELPIALQPKHEVGAIVGQAIYGKCIDADAGSSYDSAQLFESSKTLYAGGDFVDRCYTWNNGKTKLIEGVCHDNTFHYMYVDCADLNTAEDTYHCVNQAEGTFGSCTKVAFS